ncbi:hypothetical protein AAEH84_04695 [Shewanella indica]|uniref:hypothetical protein n=1 Tax=Shewanella indica TaxID=768528 RepID=UPI00313E878D
MTDLVNQDCSYVKGFVWTAQIKEKAVFLAKKPEWVLSGGRLLFVPVSKNHNDWRHLNHLHIKKGANGLLR